MLLKASPLRLIGAHDHERGEQDEGQRDGDREQDQPGAERVGTVRPTAPSERGNWLQGIHLRFRVPLLVRPGNRTDRNGTLT